MAILPKEKRNSGDSRTSTCVKVINQNIYLLSTYDKSDTEIISDKELNELLNIAGL